MLIATIIIGQVGNQDLFCHRQKHFLQNITIGVRHFRNENTEQNFIIFVVRLFYKSAILEKPGQSTRGLSKVNTKD